VWYSLCKGLLLHLNLSTGHEYFLIPSHALTTKPYSTKKLQRRLNFHFKFWLPFHSAVNWCKYCFLPQLLPNEVTAKCPTNGKKVSHKRKTILHKGKKSVPQKEKKESHKRKKSVPSIQVQPFWYQQCYCRLRLSVVGATLSLIWFCPQTHCKSLQSWIGRLTDNNKASFKQTFWEQGEIGRRHIFNIWIKWYRHWALIFFKLCRCV